MIASVARGDDLEGAGLGRQVGVEDDETRTARLRLAATQPASHARRSAPRSTRRATTRPWGPGSSTATGWSARDGSSRRATTTGQSGHHTPRVRSAGEDTDPFACAVIGDADLRGPGREEAVPRVEPGPRATLDPQARGRRRPASGSRDR